MDRHRRLRLALPVLLALTLAACGAARHVAVVADATFAQAVFAVDDAATSACQTKVLTAAQCAAADPKIKKALLDVVAVSEAIKASPKDFAVPKNLPDLLTDLTAIQGIVAPAAQVAPDLTAKVNYALSQAILVVAKFTGGN
jgi:hypothetical protein